MSGSAKTRAGKKAKQTELLQSTLPVQLRRSSVPILTGLQEGQSIQPTLGEMAAGGLDPVSKEILEQLAALNKKADEQAARFDEQAAKFDQVTASINKLTDQVTKNTQAIGNIEKSTTENRKLVEEVNTKADENKKRIEELRGEVRPLSRQVSEQQVYLSLAELKNRENNLRIRNIPELEKEDLIGFLTTEIAKFWGLAEEKDFKIVTAFRLGRVAKKDKPRDCLIILRSRQEKENILGLHFKNSLVIQGKKAEIFRDIPKQLLDLRATYKDLATLLRNNTIPYRWEFPQGLSFTLKGEKVRIRTAEEQEKFLKDHGEDLRKGIAGVWPPPSFGLNPAPPPDKNEKGDTPTGQ
uniref:uncharacterized protein LOC114600806 n=1 Tax=Podarcis muralis TaxID=64176 RepID=UPI00109FF812|nr:uncharacterized protein LOC114600806 [Podarcis muralis]